MKLFILLRVSETDWDENRSLVVRAEDIKQARRIAADNAASEGQDVWLSKRRSVCQQLEEDGQAGVIIVDFKAG